MQQMITEIEIGSSVSVHLILYNQTEIMLGSDLKVEINNLESIRGRGIPFPLEMNNVVGN